MKKTRYISLDRLKTLLSYDQLTGHLTWRVSAGRRVRPGDVAGQLDRLGYRRITIDYGVFSAHRLAWFYTYGEWPAGDLDHINGIRDDNRLSNLRIATKAQNHANSRRPKNNTSGFKGVSWYKAGRCWRAHIAISGKKIFLGNFERPETAHAVYCAKARELFGEFARDA